ncbi:MAG: LysM peptidoglycan-binding domain-containing protein [Anaerolinea sp.]
MVNFWKRFLFAGILMGWICTFLLSACAPLENSQAQSFSDSANLPGQPVDAPQDTPTPMPTRPVYQPGELVDYVAQTGDTLPAIAAHFNTTVKEILEANPFIPADATTMPPGMPMKIPIYYQPLWGSPYQILPDSHFVNGPALIGFDTQKFVLLQPGWLRFYSEYVADRERSGAEIVEYVANNYSISPRVLLAILEYQLGALTNPRMPEGLDAYPLGEEDISYRGLYRQLAWTANFLNQQYYTWRQRRLEITLPDGQLERPDPWQNAATVALQVYFARRLTIEGYRIAISSEGFARTYQQLFGDPWTSEPHIPGSLRQPELSLPFGAGKSWSFTGGPHTAWGEGEPFAALDFAPPSVVGGCSDTEEFATAVASGKIVRTGTGIAVLDLDGDGDERTGWVIFYLHIASDGKAPLGSELQAGDPIGKPSCEGGRATGTHVHIARKFNGEWIPADGVIPFNLEGWIARNGAAPYEGWLTRQNRSVKACVCSDQASQIQAQTR